MNRWIVLCVSAAINLTPAFCQDAAGTSTVTLGIGGGWLTKSGFLGIAGGPVLNGTYEFRFLKYLAVETGVHNTLTAFNQYSSSILVGTNLFPYTTTIISVPGRGNGRDTSVPLGFRAILPVRNGKAELFAAVDGGFIWNTNRGGEGWEVQPGVGVRVAVDRQRHFWLGTSANYSHEFATSTKNWVTWTADLGFRFGH